MSARRWRQPSGGRRSPRRSHARRPRAPRAAGRCWPPPALTPPAVRSVGRRPRRRRPAPPVAAGAATAGPGRDVHLAREQGRAGRSESGSPVPVRTDRVGAGERLKVRVEVLHQQPAACTQSADHVLHGLLPSWNVNEDQTFMDEIKRTTRGGSSAATSCRRTSTLSRSMPWTHRRSMSVAVTPPAGPLGPTTSEAPTAHRLRPPGSAKLRDPQPLDMAERHRVEQRSETVEPLLRFRRPVVEQIAGPGRRVRSAHHPRRPSVRTTSSRNTDKGVVGAQ